MTGGFVAEPGTDWTFGAEPKIAAAFQALGQRLGLTITGTSGHRTLAQQAALYANRASNPNPVAPPTNRDQHVQGIAGDATVNGKPIQDVVSASDLASVGLKGLAGDRVHVSYVGAPAGSSGLLGTAWDTVKDSLSPSGGPHDLTAPAAATISGSINDAFSSTASDLGRVAGAAANDLAEPVARSLVSMAEDAIGKDLLRWTLYAALVVGGVVLVFFGGARALGAGPS